MGFFNFARYCRIDLQGILIYISTLSEESSALNIFFWKKEIIYSA